MPSCWIAGGDATWFLTVGRLLEPDERHTVGNPEAERIGKGNSRSQLEPAVHHRVLRRLGCYLYACLELFRSPWPRLPYALPYDCSPGTKDCAVWI